MFEGVFWSYRFRCRLYAEDAVVARRADVLLGEIHRAERTAPTSLTFCTICTVFSCPPDASHAPMNCQ
jgi:hypothetical protein